VSRRHTVLLVHGIRTQAEWQQRVADALQQDPTIRVVPTRYGFFDVLRFLGPQRLRRAPVARIARLIRDERSNPRTEQLSVIAHSFGTWIVGELLASESDIKIFRLILCGSVLRDDFEWERYAYRFGAGESEWDIVNDCGMKDAWPVLAQSLTTGYGASGRFGFGHTRVRDRFHEGGHSDFFSKAFAEKHWLRFLTHGEVTRGELERPVTPWWLSVITVFKLRHAALVLVLAGVLWGTGALTKVRAVLGALRSTPDVSDSRTVATDLDEVLSVKTVANAEMVRMGLWIGGPISARNQEQLRRLTDALFKENARIVAVAAPVTPWNDSIRKLVSNHSDVALFTDARDFVSRSHVDGVLLLGFMNQPGQYSAITGMRSRADDRDISVLMVTQLGQHTYVFADEKVWSPSQTIREVARKYRVAIWAGNEDADDLRQFMKYLRTGDSGSGPVR
jgi:hypothetical protein